MKNTVVIILALILTSFAGFAENTSNKEEKKNDRRLEKSQDFYRQMMLMKFDTDGDGKISEEEKAEAKKAREAKKAEFVQKYDVDGDGELSREERRNGWKAKHEEKKAEFLKKYDADGDGELSENEKTQLRDDMKKRFEEWKSKLQEKEKINTVRIP